ncbi:MAG: Ppx/GppA phosphatase family protein [Pseudomonadota bacterium]
MDGAALGASDKVAGSIHTDPTSRRRAVIDIGSNSVRLVIFDGPTRAPFAVVNEKSLCGLGKGIGEDGLIDDDAIDLALSALKRFKRIIEAHGSPNTLAVATAAVRTASNGGAFVAAARDLGIDVSVIDGEREAILSALGVISFEPHASGLIGDMGGGSLELVAVQDGALGQAASLQAGALAMMQAADGDISSAKKIATQMIEPLADELDLSTNTLYAVGGAWRSIARLHMRLRDYPLSILHGYEIAKSELLDLCGFIAKQSRESLLALDGAPRKRIDTLPFAAVVLGTVIKSFKIKRVMVSAGGLREGLIYETASPERRAEDPLLVGATFFADRLGPRDDDYRLAFDLIAPLLQTDQTYNERVTKAAAILADTSAFFHPDARGAHAFDAVIRASLFGLTHAERVQLALALYARYEGGRTEQFFDRPLALISPEERLFAIRLGLALRLTSSLAPKAPGVLSSLRLSLDNNEIVLAADRNEGVLLLEAATKRLSALADAFGASYRIVSG